MGQQEVFTFLKENRNKWFTAREISKKLKASFTSITPSLKKLRESEQLNYKIIKVTSYTLGRRKVFIYKFKE